MTLFKKNCQNSCLQIYNRVMLLLSHVLPGDSGKCFIKDVLPHRGWFCFFLRLEQKFWKRIPLWNSVLVMEFLLNDFFFLVSSYGDLCFKGPWGNLKRSTEKNQNLKKDQLKKIFFSMAGFLSLDIGDTLDQIIPFMLIASPTPVWQPKVSPDIAKCCCGAKFLWVENHCSMGFSASEY